MKEAALAQCVASVRRVARIEKIHPSAMTQRDWLARQTGLDELDLHVAGGWQAVLDQACVEVPLQGITAAAQNVTAGVDACIGGLRERELLRANKELALEVATLRSALERIDAGTRREPPKIAPRERTSEEREGTLVALCSDWHVEETVDPAQVNGRNEYNLDVARRRVRKLVEGLLWQLEMHRSAYHIRDMVLALLGDMITGYIHEELLETNSCSPMEAVIFCQDLIAAELLEPLLAESDLDRIVVPCCYGNHGRTTQRKRYKNAAVNSFEWGMYHALAQRYAKEPRLDFQIARGAHAYVDVYSWRLRMHHGDYVRFFGGIGGPLTPINKCLLEWNKNIHADITCIAHFHQYFSAEHVVANGSLIGWSEYALSLKAAYEPPQQALFLMDSRRGKRNSTRLWVDDVELEGSR